MTLAPTNGDWSSRVDPTKLKNRKFNTGRGAKAPPQAVSKGGDASWHETPEQKQARLKREVMGIKDTAVSEKSSGAELGKGTHDEDTAKRLKEYNVRVLFLRTVFSFSTSVHYSIINHLCFYHVQSAASLSPHTT